MLNRTKHNMRLKLIYLCLIANFLNACGSTPAPTNTTNQIIEQSYTSIYGGEVGELPTSEITKIPELRRAFTRWMDIFNSPPPVNNINLENHKECVGFTAKNLDQLQQISKYDKSRELSLFDQLQESSTDEHLGNITEFKYFTKNEVPCPNLNENDTFNVDGIAITKTKSEHHAFLEPNVTERSQFYKNCSINRDSEGRYITCDEIITVSKTVMGDSDERTLHERTSQSLIYYTAFNSGRSGVAIINAGIYTGNLHKTSISLYQGREQWVKRVYSGKRLIIESNGSAENYTVKTYKLNRQPEIECIRDGQKVAALLCND